MRTCPACHVEVSADHAFCGYCGAKVPPGEAASARVGPQGSQSSPNVPVPSIVETDLGPFDTTAPSGPAPGAPAGAAGAAAERPSAPAVSQGRGGTAEMPVKSGTGRPAAIAEAIRSTKTRPDSPVSPLATSSILEDPSHVPSGLRPSPSPSPPRATPSYRGLPRVGEPAGPPPAYPATGSHVLVVWSDGNKYPGTLQRMQGSQCLICFQDGQLRWVDQSFVEPKGV